MGILNSTAPSASVAQAADADLTAIAARATDVTIDLAAGAADVCTITVTAVDANGVTVTGVQELELWMSESAVGAGLTADTYSGSLVAVTGTILETVTAKKHFRVLTHTTGVFVGSLTDSAKPADQYVAVKKPIGAALKMSAATAALWGA
jgi:hypothetical protein